MPAGIRHVDVLASWAVDALRRGDKVCYLPNGAETADVPNGGETAGDSSGACGADPARRGSPRPAASGRNGSADELPFLLRSMSDQLDVRAALRERRFDVLDADVLLRPGGLRSLLDGVASEGFEGLCVSADLTTTLRRLGAAPAAALESELDRLCAAPATTAPPAGEAVMPRLSVLCRIDQAVCEGKPEVLARHTSICAGGLSVRVEPGGVAIAGEVDLANERVLAAVLRAVLPPRGTFVVEAEGLRFLSVGAARSLVVLTEPLRRNGGRVVLLHPQSIVRRVIAASGFGERLEL